MRLICPAIPVSGIAFVLLYAVQVGMDPGTNRIGLLLSQFVGFVLLAFGVVPESLQGVAGRGGR